MLMNTTCSDKPFSILLLTKTSLFTTTAQLQETWQYAVRYVRHTSLISSRRLSSHGGSSIGGAESDISSNRSSSDSSTISCVMSTEGSFPWTWHIFSQISSQPAFSWKLSAKSKLSPSDQTMSVSYKKKKKDTNVVNTISVCIKVADFLYKQGQRNWILHQLDFT